MELTETNKLYTYLERCKAGAKTFSSVMDKLTKEEQEANQEWIAETCSQTWQVETVDMLAETNTSWR